MKYIKELWEIVIDISFIALFFAFLMFVFGAHPVILGFFFLAYVYFSIEKFINFIKDENKKD